MCDSKKRKNKQNCDKENLIKIIANVKTKERDSSENILLLQYIYLIFYNKSLLSLTPFHFL